MYIEKCFKNKFGIFLKAVYLIVCHVILFNCNTVLLAMIKINLILISYYFYSHCC